MKPQHSFVAERVAAQHCQELLRRMANPADLITALSGLGDRFARLLGPAFAALLGGDPPIVAVAAPAELTELELGDEAGTLAANCLLATTIPGLALLVSVDGRATLRLVDRAFGGRGDTSGALPERFPLSAQLMIERLEQLIAKCLGAALNHGDLRVVKRDSRLSELAPFPAGAKLAVLRIEIKEGADAPWKLLIALPATQLAKLLGNSNAAAPREPRSADPSAAPFAELPLPLTATLVDMQVPLSVLAALEPGAVLPITVARAVPLSTGGAVLARGTIGTQDDRVALKLSQIA